MHFIISSAALSVPFALSSHYVFNRHEPRPLHFILIALGFVFLAPIVLNPLYQDTSIPYSLIQSFVCLSIYLTTLSSSMIAYRLSPWHPLSQYPGPKLAAITKWWMIYFILFRGGRHRILQELHSKYGDSVRVGPNELSINTAAAVNPIYLNLHRASYYRGVPTSSDTLITITDRKEHTQRRRAWNKSLSRTEMPKFALMANTRIEQLLGIFSGGVASKAVDLHQWMSLLLMDMIGDMAFSGGFETMKAGKDIDGWMHMLDIGAAIVAVLGQIPWSREIAALLPQKGPIETFHSFANKKIEESTTRQLTYGIKSDILSVILNDHHDGGYRLSDDEAAADASLLIASSLETTSQAITTIFRHLAADKIVLARLQAELDEVVGAEVDELDYATLEKLQYLDACVQESLRIIPPAPAGPPRTTGEKGAIILERYVPPNTTVYVPTWALQRDADNFRDPEAFIPERWLPGSTISPHNTDAFIPFSAGFGACVGKQLALQNIKLVVAHIVRRFSVEFPNGFSAIRFDDSYKERSLWVHDPLLVKLTPREI
ncbi:cytochrome P450 [Crucibulum laeve]|uniref:Cytochrome P450 n=1 Tax=Crucibulum laeve TaxID=68775 RepID=A0A5C3LLQ0_9AGAR|nr:cytochrome P450 [Crucibulum laeve]